MQEKINLVSDETTIRRVVVIVTVDTTRVRRFNNENRGERKKYSEREGRGKLIVKINSYCNNRRVFSVTVAVVGVSFFPKLCLCARGIISGGPTRMRIRLRDNIIIGT